MSTLIENKKVRFNYEILKTLETGIELRGFEVKSLRNKRGSLDGAYVVVRGGEVYLLSAHIPPYQPNNTPKEYDPNRPRKLLLHKKEIKMLVGTEKQKGLTLVPIKMYNKGRTIKVAIAVVRGKKKYDKRQTIRRREDERKMRRTLKKEY